MWFLWERGERGRTEATRSPPLHRPLTHRNGSFFLSLSLTPTLPPLVLEFCPWRPGERGLLLVGEQQQEQPAEAQQQREADGLGAAVRQARRGKSGVSLVAPQSVVLVYLKRETYSISHPFFKIFWGRKMNLQIPHQDLFSSSSRRK